MICNNLSVNEKGHLTLGGVDTVDMAEKYGTTNTGMVVSWILRHPAKMQPIIGTTTVERIQQIAQASDVDITREDWYAIYKAAGNNLP